MKRRNIKCLIIAAAVLALVLSGCGTEERIFDAGAYRLSGVSMEGTELDANKLYPEGGSLLLSADGTGVLTLGENTSEILWSRQNELYEFRINDLKAAGKCTDGNLLVEIGELGICYGFSESTAPPKDDTASDGTESGESRVRWTGRLWFSDTDGEWSDYEWSTMSLYADVIEEDESGGVIQIWQDFYSEDYPMAEIRYSVGEKKILSVSGYMMSYPVAPGTVSITMQKELPSEIEDTLIMHPDIYEYGHYYSSDPDSGETEEIPVDVLRLTGKCEDDDGRFSYRIVLTKE